METSIVFGSFVIGAAARVHATVFLARGRKTVSMLGLGLIDEVHAEVERSGQARPKHGLPDMVITMSRGWVLCEVYSMSVYLRWEYEDGFVPDLSHKKYDEVNV